jgi:hypothetical protein
MPEFIDIRGWLVAEATPTIWPVVADDAGRRLALYRRLGGWTLLREHRWLRRDGTDRPIDGRASVRATDHADLAGVAAALERESAAWDWRALLEAGWQATDPDPEVRTLWAPVQIDRELDQASVHHRELGEREAGRQDPGWKAAALCLSAVRLEELGFVMLEVHEDHDEVFRRGLGRMWDDTGYAMVGALVAAHHGYRIAIVVAVDGAGEVFPRTADHGAGPGARRSYPHRPLSDREREEVQRIYRHRREERDR